MGLGKGDGLRHRPSMTLVYAHWCTSCCTGSDLCEKDICLEALVSVLRGIQLVDTQRDTQGSPDLCVSKHLGKPGVGSYTGDEKEWGARVNILREQIGRGDVLKSNIDMGDKAERTAETLSRGSTSIHR